MHPLAFIKYVFHWQSHKVSWMGCCWDDPAIGIAYVQYHHDDLVNLRASHWLCDSVKVKSPCVCEEILDDYSFAVHTYFIIMSGSVKLYVTWLKFTAVERLAGYQSCFSSNVQVPMYYPVSVSHTHLNWHVIQLIFEFYFNHSIITLLLVMILVQWGSLIHVQ